MVGQVVQAGPSHPRARVLLNRGWSQLGPSLSPSIRGHRPAKSSSRAVPGGSCSAASRRRCPRRGGTCPASRSWAGSPACSPSRTTCTAPRQGSNGPRQASASSHRWIGEVTPVFHARHTPASLR